MDFKLTLKSLVNKKIFWGGVVIGMIIILVPGFYFLDMEAVRGNLGPTILYIEIITTILIALMFGIFFGASIYKMHAFRTTSIKVSGLLGGLMGILISGCPACSITLISYIGLTFGGLTLSQLLYKLPFHGLELKFLSLIILCIAVYSTIKNINSCKIKIKKVNK